MDLRAEHLTFTRRGRTILRDVSLRMERGTVSVIIGPNGAGKSTLLSCLAGLHIPSSGDVRLGNASLGSLTHRDRARRIGLLDQKADIHWNIEARSLVALGRLPHQGRWGPDATDEAAIDQAMARTDCVHLAHRPAQQLSGGEQGRVLLARVLAGEPEWLLADEPLANLDPVHQIDAMACLRDVAASGVGVVMVLHDLTQAARIADQVIVIDQGQVAAAGPPDAVLTPDLFGDVFRVRVHVDTGPDGRPILTPIGRAD
ncbi:ABC transporter ATP-binding protein [Sphingobium subterraneum]|uniref:Iron complex transport system ATP-binding protein n=1 Tax=Sphingobium subterraneum TaxID=627688 RepID=A0A841IV20_9SPHN|nr:ABC transporter ATP-binding protein [Sphingobium subterraneum]MBB6122523.1 iron complex transport system ATP-binding protein [Sphingobium subterraneum]